MVSTSLKHCRFAVSQYELTATRPTNPLYRCQDRASSYGHGRSALWKDLKDHLQDQHHYPVVAYETGARARHTVRDILQEMMASSSFALLVLTGDDKISDDTYRARQNVIHEAGLFQGKLGFSRAIILMQDDVEEFSNIAGIHQIRFSKGNIKETFGDVLATIRREFDAS